MNIFDLDKNSLPEQVQINKENIATLMTDPTTKQYVDDQDAATLQLAKDYADNADDIVSRYIRNNYVYLLSVINPFIDTLTYDVDDLVAYRADSDSPYMFYRCHTAVTIAGSWTGVTNWEQVKLQDLLALKQDNLTTTSVPNGTLDKSIGFDTDGNLVKGYAGGGSSETLIWSGILELAASTTIPYTLVTDKTYKFVLKSNSSNSYDIQYIKFNGDYCLRMIDMSSVGAVDFRCSRIVSGTVDQVRNMRASAGISSPSWSNINANVNVVEVYEL